MGTQIPEIRKLNRVAIAGMADRDVFEAREYHIACLVKARRANDADTLKAAIDWIVALSEEMRLRGGSEPKPENTGFIL